MSDAARSAVRRWFETSELTAFGSGHIHDTYLVSSGAERFVLQRINRDVFDDPERLMAQTRRVLDAWRASDEYVCPRLVPSLDGRSWLEEANQCWRVWAFIPGVTVDPPTSPEQIEAAGRAFGTFQRAMAELDTVLVPTIEGFLDLDQYLIAYDEVADRASRAHRRLIDDARSLSTVFAGRRTTIHGDCKVNNLIYDERGGVRAIIDFDTVMSGHPALDLGDLIRSVSLSRGGYRPADALAAASGFKQAGVEFTPVEIADAPRALAFMLGIRFLTDHLNGDRYFKVSRAGENLERADAQFALLDQMTASRESTLAASSS